jgi:hypothetical protein
MVGMVFTHKHCSMVVTLQGILRTGTPAEIDGSVIRSDAITMRYLRARRTKAVKCFTNRKMHSQLCDATTSFVYTELVIPSV